MKSALAPITLRDIAEKSGVSITTASRILNRRDTSIPIREETRQRVLNTATQLGYKPNLLARGLRGSRSSLLGVIARDISDPFHTLALRGINETANLRGYRLFLGHVDYQPDVALTYGSMFEQSHADGIILMGDIQGDQDALQLMAHRHRHIVGVADRVSRRLFAGVYADSIVGTRLALDHLWNLGHRRIICISDPRIDDERLRVEQYRKFMQDHGAENHARVYLTAQEPQPSFKLGMEIFASILDASVLDTSAADANLVGNAHRSVPSHRSAAPPPTAIFAAADTIAIGILQAAYRSGIKIPDQISIVGFDNIEFTEFTVPPLTTVSQLGVEMGHAAANLLIDMIEQDRASTDVDDVVLEPALVIRSSTAPPAS